MLTLGIVKFHMHRFVDTLKHVIEESGRISFWFLIAVCIACVLTSTSEDGARDSTNSSVIKIVIPTGPKHYYHTDRQKNVNGVTFIRIRWARAFQPERNGPGANQARGLVLQWKERDTVFKGKWHDSHYFERDIKFLHYQSEVRTFC